MRRRRGVALAATVALVLTPLVGVTTVATAADGSTTTLLSVNFDDGTKGTLGQSGAAGTYVDLGAGNKAYQVHRAASYDGLDTPAGLLDGLEAGTVVTVSAQARIVSGDTNVPARWVTKPGYSWLGTDVTLTSEWKTVTTQYTIPETSPQSQFFFGTGPYPEPTPALDFTYQLDDVVVSVPGEPGTPEPTVVLSNDFESSTAPWGARNSTVAATDTEAHGGAHSLLVSGRGANWAGTEADLLSTLEAGKEYQVSAWVKLPTGTAGASAIKITAVTSTGDGDSYNAVTTSPSATADGWVELTGTYTPAADLTKLVFYFEAADIDTTHPSFLVDDVLILGPAGEVEPPVGTEPLVETDFETGTLEGWALRADEHGDPVVAVTDELAHGGTYSARVSERPSQGAGLQYPVTETAVAGASYDVSAWVRFEGTPGDMTLSSRTLTGETAKYSNLVQFTGLSSSSWVHVTGTFTMPAFETAAELYFETKYTSTGLGNTSTFVIDDIAVTPTPDVAIEDLTPLKDTVDFPVGVAIDSRETAGTASQLLLKHFDQVTSENYMKVEAWYSGTGVDTFRLHPEAKTLMDYAAENELNVYGHTLAWHSQTPAWFFQDDEGNDLAPDALRQRLHDHIFNVAQALSDEYGAFGSDGNPLVAFDVVNEVVNDGTSNPDGMRESKWYQILGEEFVDDAFQYANEAFNDEYAAEGVEHPVTLFINDYNTEQTGKRARYKALVERLIARDVPIDGVGHQFHVALSTPVSSLDDAIADFEGIETASGRPLVQAVTELDVFVGSADTAKSIDQGYYYEAAFDAFREHASSLFSVTVWGLTDGRSWRASGNGKPLLFNDNFSAKPAFFGAADLGLPAAIRSATAFAADEDGDYSSSSGQWQRLPLNPVGEKAGFQLRWTPEGLTVYVDVDDATVDDTDAVVLETPDGAVSFGRDGTGDVDGTATERTGGWTAVVELPVDSLVEGGAVDLDVRVVDGATTTAWNSPDVLGSIALAEPLSFGEVHEATTAPSIDGDVDAQWSTAGTLVSAKHTSGSGTAEGSFRTLWNGSTLYVLADVTDADVDTTGSDPWTKDSVEIYVDGGNVKNGSYRYDDTQIRIDADGAVSFGTGDETFQRNRLTSAVVRTDDGYRVEAAISLLEYGGTGTFHGLDLQVNDASGGVRNGITNWADPTGRGYQSTGHWGVVELVGPGAPVAVAPVVTQQPETTITAPLGSTVTIVTAASGTPAPTVSWEIRRPGKDWAAVAGSKPSRSLVLTAALDGASYRATYTNSAGTVTTQPATVRVARVKPVVTSQPVSVSGEYGSVVTVSAAASGYPNPKVTWQKRVPGSSTWVAIPSATSRTLKVKLYGSTDGLRVRAVFTNGSGQAVTKVATVRVVRTTPTITAQPSSTTVAAWAKARFEVTVAGYPKPRLQWFEKRAGATAWTPLAGATSATLNVTASPTRNGALYRVVATNDSGTATSKAVRLTVS
ncbi:hypothetical protein CCO02nite_21900 [Cellulomonas composti]|uniref:Beta-xylanase n=1 Tax=Cellulomonas composti TaxID=266130 RepID=A0A511JC11_9CELL|nr:hypothetical protein CCO02nite_21900 [Cellulomonas composti]